MRKLFNWLTLLIIILLSTPVLLKAQFTDPDDVADNPVPFDDGVTLLLAAAVAYGIKKGNKKKKAPKALEQ